METIAKLRQTHAVPDRLARKTSSKGKWANPKDSVGDLIGHIGRQKCWLAIGPARKIFLDISRDIKSFLDQQTEVTSCWVTWSIYMVGDSEETAVPTIIFCAEDEKHRRSIRDRVRKRGMLERYPPGVSLKHLPRAPDWKQLVQLASGAPDSPFSMSSAPTGHYVFALSHWPSIGDRLWMEGESTALRTATAGGSISFKGQRLLMTAAHPFDQPLFASSVSDIDDQEMYFSDSEDEPDASSEISYDSSLTIDESLVQGFKAMTLEPTESTGLPSEPPPPGAPALTTSHDYLPFEHETVGTLLYSSILHHRPETEGGLDYALIRYKFIKASGDGATDGSKAPHWEFPNHVTRTAYHELPATVVVANTSSAGVVAGQMALTPVFMRLPYDTRNQQVYPMKLTSHLGKGDCGAWVYDAASMLLRGHIVAGSSDGMTTFIVPAFQVFEELRQPATQNQIDEALTWSDTEGVYEVPDSDALPGLATTTSTMFTSRRPMLARLAYETEDEDDKDDSSIANHAPERRRTRMTRTSTSRESVLSKLTRNH